MLNVIKANYNMVWKNLFEIANLGDLDKPLTPNILSDPNSKVTRHLLYLYTMESFIYPDLNRASREKDESKIQYYGAYAAALSYIIYFANRNLKVNKKKGTTRIYRGVNLTKEEADSFV